MVRTPTITIMLAIRRITRTIDVSAREKPRRSRQTTTGRNTIATTHASTTGTTTLAILKTMTIRARTNSPTTEIRTAQFQRSTESTIGILGSITPLPARNAFAGYQIGEDQSGGDARHFA